MARIIAQSGSWVALVMAIALLTGTGLTLGDDDSPKSVAPKQEQEKRALAILGDAHHCTYPIYSAIVTKLKRGGYETDTILDYSVPFDDLAKYDLIVLSRYGVDDITLCKQFDFNFAVCRDHRWMTGSQEQKFEEYVLAGGRIFLHHDAVAYYPKGGPINRLAKAYFLKHPPSVRITVSPTEKDSHLTRDVEPFTIVDEEYQMVMAENQTFVYLKSYSEEHGNTPQGWAHSYGKGKVAVLIPGHEKSVLSHPMVNRCIQNVLDWLSQD